MRNIGELYLNHYEKFLGQFVDRKVYKGDDMYAIQFLEYRNIFDGCRTYMSLGLSNYANVINQNCEIALVVDDYFDLSVELLANTLFYIIEKKMSFGAGVHIGGIENISNKFAKKSKKNAIYFSEATAFPNEFSYLDEIDGYIYMAFFISEREYQYIDERGADEFEDLLESLNCDVFDIKRESIL